MRPTKSEMMAFWFSMDTLSLSSSSSTEMRQYPAIFNASLIIYLPVSMES